MFFFFVGGVEQGAGWVVKEAVGRCLQCGGTLDLVETKKALKLFFVPVWRWPGKDPAYLCRECGLLALGSLGTEPGPSLLPREARCGACSRAVNPQFRRAGRWRPARAWAVGGAVMPSAPPLPRFLPILSLSPPSLSSLVEGAEMELRRSDPAPASRDQAAGA